MKKTHYIFDLDDTITNSYDFNQQLFVDLFLPYLPDIDQKYLRKLHFRSRGKAMDLQFTEVVRHFKLEVSINQLVKESEKMHIEHSHKIAVFESAANVFCTLKEKGKVLSICTNRENSSSLPILKNNGIDLYFDNVISCIDAGHQKPDPYCLQQLIKKYDIPKEEYLYFGDSKTDHDFAKNAGIDFVIINQYLNQKKFFKIFMEAFL